MLSDVKGTTCREYVAYRTAQPRKASKPDVTGRPARMVTAAGARRELEDLRAAINYHRAEGLCSEVVGVALPEKSAPREDWLTRSEAARLIWAAWRAKQKMGEGITDRNVGRHVARFMLVGFYTGTRHAAICAAAFNPAIGRGHVDLERGVFYRHRQGARQTNKRQPPVRLPGRLLAHLRRWKRLGIARHAVVEWNGKPVASVRKSFAAAARVIERHITPHILKAHRRDLGDAERGECLGGGWIPRDVTGGVGPGLWPSSSGFQADVAERMSGQNRDRNTVNKRRLTTSNVTKTIDFSRSDR